MKKTIAVVLAVAALLASLPMTRSAEAQGQAMVRVWHASPDAPPVDVYVDGKPAFTNLAFPNASAYANLAPGSYDVQVFPSSAKGQGTPVIDVKDLNLAAKAYTVMAIGKLAEIKPLVLEDNLAKPAAGKAHVRFVHASPDAPAVDITTKDGTKVFSNVAFGSASEWTPLDTGSYDLQARLAGTDTVALEVPGVTLADGAILTIGATGLAAGEPKLAATVVTYEPMAAAAAPAAPAAASAASAEKPTMLPKTGGSTDWLPAMAMLAGALALLSGLAYQRRAAAAVNRD